MQMDSLRGMLKANDRLEESAQPVDIQNRMLQIAAAEREYKWRIGRLLPPTATLMCSICAMHVLGSRCAQAEDFEKPLTIAVAEKHLPASEFLSGRSIRVALRRNAQ